MKPEVEHILARWADGFVSLAQFVTKGDGGTEETPVIMETEATDAALEEFLAKAGVSWVAWRRIDPGDLPGDGTFRNAWRDSGDAVVIDMPVARDIARDYLRRARAPGLVDLDVQVARAFEQGNADLLAEVVADKQRLRDITDRPEIAVAATPQDLKAAVEQIAAGMLRP